MASFKELTGNFEGKFALTGRALLLQPARHALPMACCVLIAKS
jgi:hypothetical protein